MPKEDIENLRQGVITMFIKNTEMYNKTLNKIYKTAMAEQEKPKVYGRKAIAKWMKQIQKENQKSSKNDQAAARIMMTTPNTMPIFAILLAFSLAFTWSLLGSKLMLLTPTWY